MKLERESAPLVRTQDTTLISVAPDLLVKEPPRTRLAVDVDFSFAIHNRTGKYFIGKELLAIDSLPFGRTYYWRMAADAPPDGLRGKVIGRLQHYEILGRSMGVLGWLPRRSSNRPVLHLDPFTVPSTRLRPHDAVLIHDLGQVTWPHLFPPALSRVYARTFEEIARVGPHLVFVSEGVRAEYMERYQPHAPSSVRVIAPPVRLGVSEGATSAVPGLIEPFLLTVGSIGDRKNQARTIAAYARSGLAERGVHYVLCGGPEPGYEAVRDIASRTPGVHLLSYVTDAQLRWLYANASGFVLFSLLEGFGMPIVEAVKQGLVPLVSQGGVLEEVAGDGAVVADPIDEPEMAVAMARLAGMSGEERLNRLRRLESSMKRFGLPEFREGWRTLILDMIASHGRTARG